MRNARNTGESTFLCLPDCRQQTRVEVLTQLGDRIVERVVLHMVEPPPLDPTECLRIFVVFSGMAGAWRATKEIDGRFFGGKKIVRCHHSPSMSYV